MCSSSLIFQIPHGSHEFILSRNVAMWHPLSQQVKVRSDARALVAGLGHRETFGWKDPVVFPTVPVPRRRCLTLAWPPSRLDHVNPQKSKDRMISVATSKRSQETHLSFELLYELEPKYPSRVEMSRYHPCQDVQTSSLGGVTQLQQFRFLVIPLLRRLKYVAENEEGPKYPDRLRKMAEQHQAHLEVSALTFRCVGKWIVVDLGWTEL